MPPLVRPLREAEQRQVPDEVRHARRPRAASIHRHARDCPDQENRIRRQAQVPAFRKQVKYLATLLLESIKLAHPLIPCTLRFWKW